MQCPRCQQENSLSRWPDRVVPLGALGELDGIGRAQRIVAHERHDALDDVLFHSQQQMRASTVDKTGDRVWEHSSAFHAGPWRSKAYLLADCKEDALALAQRALELSRAQKERGHQAYTLRLHYQQALALAEELGMRPLQAHCHHGLGTLYARTGQQEQARAELSVAIELSRAADMTFWLPQAEAALVRVSEVGVAGQAQLSAAIPLLDPLS